MQKTNTVVLVPIYVNRGILHISGGIRVAQSGSFSYIFSSMDLTAALSCSMYSEPSLLRKHLFPKTLPLNEFAVVQNT